MQPMYVIVVSNIPAANGYSLFATSARDWVGTPSLEA